MSYDEPILDAELLGRALASPGTVALRYVDTVVDPEGEIVLRSHRPATHGPFSPVVLVLTDADRDGVAAREAWRAAAERHNVMVIALEFQDEVWPGALMFEDGYRVTEAGAPRAPDTWTWTVPERLHATLRRLNVTRQPRAYLYGLGTGARFAMGLLASRDVGWLASTAVAAAGVYTPPILDRPFPSGLGGITDGRSGLIRYLYADVRIVCGAADEDAADPALPKTAEALLQGRTRIARARAGHGAVRAVAEKEGLPCRWQLLEVPEVGYDPAALADATAAAWFPTG